MKPHGMAGIALGLAFLALGCAPPSTPPAAPPPPPVSSDPRDKIPHGIAPAIDRAEAAVDLKEIGTYYQLHQTDGLTARDGVLKDIQHDHPKLAKWIQDGEYILLKGDPAGAADAVIAYQKDAPTQGGMVLLLDFVPHRMTAQEFQAAAKAGQ
jgi:hypothetical protein